MAAVPHDPARFSPFVIHDVDYKVVNNHPIPLSILTPKNIIDTKEQNGKKGHPLIVQFHGGFLVAGARLYSEWFPEWLIDIAVANSAIIVAPDYRLLPESNGQDILSDLASFWSWISGHLGSELDKTFPGIQVDLDQLLVAGQSAGGYLAMQSALLHPEINAKAVLATYPMLDLRSRHFSEAYEKPIFGVPNLPVRILEQHLEQTSEGTVVTTDGDPQKGEPMTRIPVALSIVQNGRFLDRFGSDSILFPVENIERVSQFPSFVWIFHGRDDTAVPAKGSEVFAEKLKAKFADTEVRFELYEGEHGFESEVTLQTDWMKDGVARLNKYWPL